MKRRNGKRITAVLALVIAAVLLILTGCSIEDKEETQDSLVRVSLGTEITSKAIEAKEGTTDTSISYYTYKAEAGFKVSDGSPYGHMDEYSTDHYTDVSKIELILAQGMWKFYINAYNAANELIYSGSTEEWEYITKDGSKTVNIALKPYGGEGTISISGLTVPKQSDNPSSRTLTVSYSGAATGSFTAEAPASADNNGNLVFTGEKAGLPAGFYTLTFSYTDGSYKAGDQRTYALFGGKTLVLNGSLDGADFETGSVTVTAVYDSAKASDKLSITVPDTIKANQEVEFVLNGTTDTTVQWSINGLVSAPQSSTYKLVFPNPGTYTVTARLSTGETASTSLTVTAEYNIYYSLDGGTYANKPSTYTYGTGVTLGVPTKSGYDFAGWTGSNGNTANKSVTIGTTDTGDKYYTANWTAKTQTVTLKNEDDTEYKKINLNLDGNYAALYSSTNVPTKTDYVFEGWYTAKSGGGTKYEASKAVTTATTLTLYANWVPKGGNSYPYAVKFNANNGTGTMADEMFAKGTTKKLTKNTFTRTGYNFVGWSKTAGGAKTYSDEQSFTDDVVNGAKDGSTVNLYAVWELITYNITYNLDGGKVSTANPSTYNVTTAKFTLNNPTKDGYTFMGWTGTGLSSATRSVSVDKGSTGNKTYTATWAKAFTVTYDANGGENAPAAQTKTYGVDLTLTKDVPTRDGFVCVGWSTSADGDVEYNNGDILSVNDDVYLYSVWYLYVRYWDESGNVLSVVPAKTGTRLAVDDCDAANFYGWIDVASPRILLRAKDVLKLTKSVELHRCVGWNDGDRIVYPVDGVLFKVKNADNANYNFYTYDRKRIDMSGDSWLIDDLKSASYYSVENDVGKFYLCGGKVGNDSVSTAQNSNYFNNWKVRADGRDYGLPSKSYLADMLNYEGAGVLGGSDSGGAWSGTKDSGSNYYYAYYDTDVKRWDLAAFSTGNWISYAIYAVTSI